MSRRKRSFLVTGLAVALILSLTAGAFGASGTAKQLSAIFRNIQLNVNGAVLETEEQPFIVNGRTYVPLRVISQALGAIVDWNSDSNLVTITGSDSSSEIEALKAENAQLKAQLAALKGSGSGVTPAEEDKTLSKLAGIILTKHPELEDVTVDDIRLTGNEDNVTVNIDVDLDDFDKEWAALMDNEIKNWITDLCRDVQGYYSTDTSVDGKIKDIDSKDTLIEFSKDRTRPLNIRYKDKEYRDGKGINLNELEKSWEGEKYSIQGFRFSLKDLNYNTSKDEIDIMLMSSDVSAVNWKTVDSSAVKDWVKGICKEIADSFINNTTEDPEKVNVRIYDKAQNSLEFFRYDVDSESL